LPTVDNDSTSQWSERLTDGARGVTFGFESVPTGNEISATVESSFRAEYQGDFRFRIDVPLCGLISLQFILSPKDADEFRSAVGGKVFLSPDEIARIKERPAVEDKLQSLDMLTFQTGLENLGAEVGLVKTPNSKGNSDNDLFYRLLQTSITRFGLLAVIGFWVSIFVSLYRYNIRLAAFYSARADLLLMMGPGITVSDFGLMVAALTPTLEFGKAPQPPIGQVIDLVKAAKK
jgi:hypothetical protein